MKKSLLVLMLLAVGIQLTAQAPIADPNAPIITFQSEVIDYGNVQQGSEAVHEFVFTNTGKTALVISGIKGQCGCTTISDWSKDPIPPGGTAKFKVKYDTTIRVGMFDKKIMVSSNASNGVNGIIEVKIKGNVVPAGAPASGGN